MGSFACGLVICYFYVSFVVVIYNNMEMERSVIFIFMEFQCCWTFQCYFQGHILMVLFASFKQNIYKKYKKK